MRTIIEFETIVDRKTGELVSNWSTDEVEIVVRVNVVAHDALQHAAARIGEQVTAGGVVPSKRAKCGAVVLAEWVREAWGEERITLVNENGRRRTKLSA